jgi:hypothetical protein
MVDLGIATVTLKLTFEKFGSSNPKFSNPSLFIWKSLYNNTGTRMRLGQCPVQTDV